MTHRANKLADLLAEHDYVLNVAELLPHLPSSAIRWQIESGRWQRPCNGVIVAHSGPLTDEQRLRVALGWAGPGSALAGLTAASLDGLIGFAGSYRGDQSPIYVLVPVGRWVRKDRPAFPVIVHYSRLLGPDAVHPAKQPRRTRIARSLIDAASWMPTTRGAQAILASGVQQGLSLIAELTAVAEAHPTRRRRKLIATTLADIAGGARALSELDFTTRVIRPFGLPEPDRQHKRKDSEGRNRYLDAYWVKERLVVEIDGAQHMDPLQHWDDMSRDNDLITDGQRVLRFPGWLVRHNPQAAAVKIRAALSRAM